MKLENYKNRFNTYYSVDPVTQCWIWNKSTHKSRYGDSTLTVGGYTIRYAHRVSYYLHNGLFDYTLCVMHTCDNPPCVNPTHLILGSHQDNITDMINKDRANKSKGNAHYNVALSEQDVENIRAQFTGRYRQQAELAKKYGVSRSAICTIVRNKRRT